MAATTTVSATGCKLLVDAAVDALDAGTAETEGSIQWVTAADAEVLVTRLANPAFGAGTSAAPSVATLLSVPITSEAAGAADTVTKANWRDRDDTAYWQDNVGTASTAIVLTNNVFGIGDFVVLTAYTLTQPAS